MVKMNEFFKFLLNPEVLNGILREEWVKLYDHEYVDNKLIAGLLANTEKLSELINHVMIKAQGVTETNSSALGSTGSTVKQVKKTTMPEPFNLTQPKPKKIMEPLKIEHKKFVTPIPYEQYQKISLNKLDEQRKERIESFKGVCVKSFDLETEKRPLKLPQIIEEVNKERNKDIDFNKKYVNPPLDYSKAPADVRFNEAAILREEFLIQKKKKQEEDELNKIIIEKKDSKEYERWKREMEEKENLQRLEEIAKRKLELELNREVAMDYYNQRIKQNQLLVAKHKEEEGKKIAEKKEQDRIELEEKKKLVKEIDKEKENIVALKEKAVEKNKESYQYQKLEYKDLTMKANEEKRIEEERRNDIIRQIRELEKIPIKRTKGFDPTETPGYGLLEELSIAELKERLELQKKFYREYEEAKREENKLKSEERTEEFLQKAKTIAKHRDDLRNQKEVERRQKKEQKEKKEQVEREIREKSLFEVKGKIENKKLKLKKEDEEFQKKIREIKLQRQYLQLGRV
jgi:hypothetical protein